MAGDSGPRFAPPDPSLPPPWRALVDGNTGYIYYWNTETNATQYDKPHAQLGHPPLPPGPPPGPGAAPNAHTPKIASEAVRASPRASTDVQSTRHADRDFDNGSLPAGSHTRGGPIGHHTGSHGGRFSGSSGSSNPNNPSGSAAGNVYLHSSIHTPSNMVSSTPRSGPSLSPRVAKSGPSIPSHAPRTGSGMSGEVLRSGSAISFGPSRSGPGLSSAGGRINARDSQWGNTAGRDSQWGSAGGKDGHWGGSGGRDSHWGGSGDRNSQLDGRDSQWGGSGSRDNQWGGSAKEGQWGSNAKEGQWGGSAKDSQWGSSSGRDSQWDSSGGRDSQWGSSKQAYHSSGSSRGGSGANVHGSGGKSIHVDLRGHAPMQPKLASVPIQHRHQDIDGMHHSAQSRHISQSILPAGGRSPLPTALTKRSASEYLSSPDLHKRPRLQAFAEPPLTLDVESYRRQHEITVVGEDVPAPIMTFDAAIFPTEILRELRSAGFLAPTPIQAQSWPIALQKRDVVAIAKTGSGKTLGYLLPGFLHLLQRGANSQSGPIVLVLAPTRELATQIHDEAVKFGRSSRISSTCVYGGASKGHQLRELEKGADIIIATPGRLNDFLDMRKVSLRQVSYLVLDEADRMLDMGFEPQIRKIVKEVPLRRQTLMFTATWPREVRKIAADLLTHAVQVNIGNSDELTANKAITQHVELVQPYEKQKRLEQILRSQEPGSKILIFCSTKKMCDQLARSLGRGFRAVAIHGDKSQVERDNVLAQFKAGRSPILVATDVAARGLDVKDIRIVINFDFPTGVEDYVHRIGRTGRAGATGVAFTFFSEQDFKYARELVKILESANQVVPLELRQLANRFPQARGRAGRWNSGSVGIRDESRERRDVSAGIHEGGVFGRDGSAGFREAGVGLRDGSLGPTDRGRAGGMGSRGGAMGGKDAGINGRFGSLTSRMGIPEVKDVVGTRPESMGGRGGGVSGRGGPLGGRGRVMGTQDVDVYGPGGDGWNDPGASDGWVEAGRGDVPHGDVWGRLGGGEWAEGGRSDANRSVSGRGGHTDGRTRAAFGSRESRFGNLDKGHTKFRDDSAGKNDGWGELVDGWSSLKSDPGWADTSGRGVSSKDLDRQDKITGSATDRTRFSSKITVSSEVRHERSHNQDDIKKSAARERGHNSTSSHSRSPSRGWGRSRSRSPAGGWVRSRSPAGGWVRSRSPTGGGWGRGLSPSGGWGRSRSPHKGTGRSRSPSHSRSPHKTHKSEHGGTASNRNKALQRSFSPPSHQVISPTTGKLEKAGVEIVSATEGEFSPSVKDNEIPSRGFLQIADFKHKIDASVHVAEQQPTEQLLEDTKLSFARHSDELGQTEEPQVLGEATATEFCSEETAATSQAVESYDEDAATLELDLSILASSNLASVIHEHQEPDKMIKTELSHQSTQLGIKHTAAAGERSFLDQIVETEETSLTSSGHLPDEAAATINYDTTTEGSKPFPEDEIDDPDGGSNTAA